jgi:anti-sigma factor RsiW
MMSTHSDVAAYVLGVLDEGAELLFEEHVSSCIECQREVVEFQTILGVLRQADEFGLFARPANATPCSGGRRSGDCGAAVRGLLLITASLVVVAGAALQALVMSLPAGNHLSCGSLVSLLWS